MDGDDTAPAAPAAAGGFGSGGGFAGFGATGNAQKGRMDFCSEPTIAYGVAGGQNL